MKTTIVIPTYNEAENVTKIISALFALPLPDLHVLVVDDNSPDGTGQIAEDLGLANQGRVHVLHRPGKMGLGTAYIEGFKMALQEGAGSVGQMDADFSHPPEKLIDLVKALDNCDIALGSRYIPGGGVDREWSMFRKALSAWGNFYSRAILGMPIHDVTGGFRLWRSRTLQSMPLDSIRSNGYVFQVEMAYVASRLGFCFIEVPIYFADRRAGTSKMSLRIQLEAAIRVWQLPGMYRHLRKIPTT